MGPANSMIKEETVKYGGNSVVHNSHIIWINMVFNEPCCDKVASNGTYQKSSKPSEIGGLPFVWD
jgi:hypothetical protein